MPIPLWLVTLLDLVGPKSRCVDSWATTPYHPIRSSLSPYIIYGKSHDSFTVTELTYYDAVPRPKCTLPTAPKLP